MKPSLLKLRWTLVYVLLIPFVNWTFAHVPTLPMPDGGFWAPAAFFTGLVLVFRDFAQREVGHWIFIPLIIGVAISFVMAPPAIALASALAFAISETVDWAIYTASKRTLSQRVMISSLVAAPLDTAAFWYMASFAVEGVFTWSTLLTAIASKLLGAYIVYRLLKRRERLTSTFTNL
jgi:uncharacterized PurR-regulated membrane protein YhhQ (DUF165 family)